MVIEIGWKNLIDEGAKLITILQGEDFPMSAAFWVSNGAYRLVIASALAAEAGSLSAYSKFLSILQRAGLQSVDYTDVVILSPTDPNYREFFESLAYRGAPRAKDVKVGASGYVYFLNPEAIPVAS